MENLYGLIGYPLSHSFSKKYFTEKFAREGITGCRYELFELPSIKEFPELLRREPQLRGLNVTIPYKQDVISYLDRLDDSAKKVGAVNVIKINDNSLEGFNSDYYGFRASLEDWAPSAELKALVLGTGGASKAVAAALKDMRIPFSMASRSSSKGDLTYHDLQSRPGIYDDYHLIVNTTPVGMSPHIDDAPPLLYEALDSRHYLYDLVYNPLETRFMKLGKERGAQVKNGLEMLELQAEKSWEIWRS